MHQFIKTALLGSVLSIVTFAAEPVADQPWESRDLTVENGLLWEIGTGTPIAYRLVPTQLSWRSRELLEHVFADGYRIVARHRLTLIADWVQNGPESRYIGVSGSPSIELWNPAGTWSLYTGSGGGLGLIDARGVKGGQGQDFTFNWFIRGGIEHVIARNTRLTAGIMYQHLSNGGQTKPNPGVDALGFTLGYSWVY
jgi:lipid A 3-O-deacylase